MAHHGVITTHLMAGTAIAVMTALRSSQHVAALLAPLWLLQKPSVLTTSTPSQVGLARLNELNTLGRNVQI